MVKIVTDSSAGIPAELVRELDIAIVPLYVHFGTQTYRDGIDLAPEEFYRRLAGDSIFPTTSAPSPATFAQVYDELAGRTDAIVSVHLSSKLSATCDSAIQGRDAMEKKDCRVEMVDSLSVLMGLGLPVIEAARAAKAGKGLAEVQAAARDAASRTHLLACFDTLEYLRRGGRIGRVTAFLGSLLHLQPVVTIKDGELEPYARERSRARALQRLHNFAEGFKGRTQGLAIEHTGSGATTKEADALAQRLRQLNGESVPLYRSGISAVIGAHTGPGAIVVTVMETPPAT